MSKIVFHINKNTSMTLETNNAKWRYIYYKYYDSVGN